MNSHHGDPVTPVCRPGSPRPTAPQPQHPASRRPVRLANARKSPLAANGRLRTDSARPGASSDGDGVILRARCRGHMWMSRQVLAAHPEVDSAYCTVSPPPAGCAPGAEGLDYRSLPVSLISATSGPANPPAASSHWRPRAAPAGRQTVHDPVASPSQLPSKGAAPPFTLQRSAAPRLQARSQRWSVTTSPVAAPA